MFSCLLEDIDRLRENREQSTLRTLLAGLLSPGFQAVLAYRFFSWCDRKTIPTQPFRYIVERFIEITTGVSIPAKCSIGKGLRIFHFGNIIFHPSLEMGDYCTVYHEVTIGDKGGTGGAAKIGNHVLIGAGAKIIGEIKIGDNCIIGANAVVVEDMPPNSVVSGNPAHYRIKNDN